MQADHRALDRLQQRQRCNQRDRQIYRKLQPDRRRIVGFDPEDLESLAALAADEPLLAHELGMALDEMFWQFADLEREMVRRRKNMLLTLRAEETRFVDTWIEALRAYLHIS